MDEPESLAVRRSVFDRLLGAGEWTLDRANPILIRHLRQEVRNRSFIAIFSLALVVSVLAAIGFAAAARGGDGGEGPALFAVLTAVLCFAMWVTQGIGAYRAMSIERDDDTWDLVDLTGMRPVTILLGKIQASVLQGLFYSAALAPFMVMAYLLRGIDILSIVVVLGLIQLGSLAVVSFAVFWACLGPNKASRALLGGLLGLKLFGNYVASMIAWADGGLRLDRIGRELVNNPQEVWTALGGTINATLAFVALCIAFSAALLTFRADNRSTGPRIAWMAITANIVLWWILGIGFAMDWDHRDLGLALGAAGVTTIISALLLGSFAVSEEWILSPRQARWISTAKGWQKPLTWFLAPGAARGRLCYLLMVIVALLLVFIGRMVFGSGSHHNGDELNVVTAVVVGLACYGSVLLWLGDLLYRTVLAIVFPTPATRRAFLLLLAAMACILPPLVTFLLDLPEVVAHLSPAVGIYEMSDEVDSLRELGGFLGAMEFGFWAALVAGAVAAGLLLGQAMGNMRVTVERVHAESRDRNPRAGG